jgi:hypothetical protein
MISKIRAAKCGWVLLGLAAFSILLLRLQQNRFSSMAASDSPTTAGHLIPGTPSTTEAAEHRSEPGSLTIEKAKKRIASAALLHDSFKRTSELSIVVRELCLTGQINEAWELIEVNPGQYRSSQIFSFFKSANLSSELFIAKFQELSLKDEQELALQGHLVSLEGEALTRFLGDLSHFKWTGDSETARNVLSRALTNALAAKVSMPLEKSDRIAARVAALKLQSQGFMDGSGLAQILKKDAYLQPREKWELLTGAVDTFPAASLGGLVRKELVESMVESDAEGALAVIGKRGSEKQAHVDLFNALKKWGVVDSVAANQWFTENQVGMDQVQRDASARAFFELAMTYGETDGAEQWARKVQDEKLKEMLLSKLPK